MRRRHIAARAASQARRLSDLVERLFDVSRIQTGQLEIVAEPVDLVAIVRAATDISAVLANAPDDQADREAGLVDRAW